MKTPPFDKRRNSDIKTVADLKGKKLKDRKDDVTGFRANTWLPSERRSMNDQRAAVEERDRERAVRDGVLDGSRAPKLTGRNRYMKVRADYIDASLSIFSPLLFTDPCLRDCLFLIFHLRLQYFLLIFNICTTHPQIIKIFLVCPIPHIHLTLLLTILILGQASQRFEH